MDEVAEVGRALGRLWDARLPGLVSRARNVAAGIAAGLAGRTAASGLAEAYAAGYRAGYWDGVADLAAAGSGEEAVSVAAEASSGVRA